MHRRRWQLLTRKASADESRPVGPFSRLGRRCILNRGVLFLRRMDYQQEYIQHEYLELKILPGRDHRNDPMFLLDPNHLHIWPRHSFMLIALPNKVSRLLQPSPMSIYNLGRALYRTNRLLAHYLPLRLSSKSYPTRTRFFHGLGHTFPTLWNS